MECRANCGACCVAPSIVEPFFGMPQGKPAGIQCVHLDDQKTCAIFDDERRPAVCGQFAPEPLFCGTSTEQAMMIMTTMEQAFHQA